MAIKHRLEVRLDRYFKHFYSRTDFHLIRHFVP